MRSWFVSCVLFAALLVVSPRAFPQAIEVNRQNRTVEVTVTETVRAEPDQAKITVGCLSYGETHDKAYQSNLESAGKVIKAILGAGISKDQIESDALELSESNPGDSSGKPSNISKLRQYRAHQSWRVRVAASEAQKLIDIAVQAGANGVESVAWEVADEESLQTKARTAAMEKARKTADELAKSAGAKLGDLLFVSNTTNELFLYAARNLQTSFASLSGEGNGFSAPAFSLKLFPEKVEKQASVRAVFAIN
jgi:uncharacterized protein YggE